MSIPLSLERAMRYALAQSMGMKTGLLGLCDSLEEEELARRKRARYVERKQREQYMPRTKIDSAPAGQAWYHFPCPVCGNEYRVALRSGLTEQQLALREPTPCPDCQESIRLLRKQVQDAKDEKKAW
jgi:hypothetical protein